MQALTTRRLLWLTFLALAVMTVYREFSCYQDYDVFWHKAVGRDLLTRGWWPYRDHYSYTYEGSRVSTLPLVYEILLYAFHAVLGEYIGAQTLHSLLLVAALAVGCRLFARSSLPVPVAFAGLCFLGMGILLRPAPRPEHTAFVLSLLALKWVIDFQARIDWWLYARLLGLLAFWANVHSSSVMGYAIVGSLCAHQGIELLLRRDFGRKKWLSLLGFALLAFCAGFATPSAHAVLYSLSMSPQWYQVIDEYYRIPISQQPLVLQLWWGAALVALAALARQRAWLPCLLLVVVGSLAMRLTKMMPHFVVLGVPCLLWLKPNTGGDVGAVWARIRKPLFAAAAAVGVVTLALTGQVAFSEPLKNEYSRDEYPVETVEYMKANGLTGRVLNFYGAGSYLIGAMGADVKVYIDGRTATLYSVEHLIKSQQLARSPGMLAAEARRWDVQYVLGPTNSLYADMVENGLGSGLFHVRFESRGHVLLERDGTARFERIARLYVSPECWDDTEVDALEHELKAARSVLPETSELRRLAELAVEFGRSRDQLAFLANAEGFRGKPVPNDRALALAAYLSLRRNMPAAALNYLAGQQRSRTLDQFYKAAALIELKQYDEAEALLSKLGIQPGAEARALLGLIERIKTRRGDLKIVNESALPELRKLVSGEGTLRPVCAEREGKLWAHEKAASDKAQGPSRARSQR